MDTVKAITLPPMMVALIKCRVGGWQRVETMAGEGVLILAVSPTTLFNATLGLAMAWGLMTAWKAEDGMHVWAHVSNPTKLMASLRLGMQVGVTEPLPEPVVLAVFDTEEVGPVLEQFKWEPTPATSNAHPGINTAETKELVSSTDPNLTPRQKEWLHELLTRNRDLFSVKLTPGQALTIPHEIDTQGHLPIKRHPYQSSLRKHDTLEEEVKQMYSARVIQESNSLWSFPVILIVKKDGSRQFCVDYHDLNKIMKCNAYPLPLIDELLNWVGGSMYWSSMDLISGYWQIPL
jgi:hypothetical protein